MNVTLLISALEQDTAGLISKMNIGSDAVIVNQCSEEGTCETTVDGHVVKIVSSCTRGVGENRNLCIDNSFGDIVLFGDDDIVYYGGYAQIVSGEFEAHPEADMIMFNVRVCEERRTYTNTEFKRLSGLNIGRYPAYSIAVKRDILIGKGLKYPVLFGGGTKYSNGEDSIFLRRALKAGVKMYASPKEIAEEIARPSTWFKGYTEKFFFDRGVLFAVLYGKLAWLWRIRFILTKKDMLKGEIGRKEANRLMKRGIKEGRTLDPEGL